MTLQIPRICKFNDVQFSVIKIDTEFGERTYSEELLFGGRYVDFSGLFESTFSITGSVVGDDNFDDLKNIFNQKQVITLTLPITNETTIDVLPLSTLKCTIFDSSTIGFYQFTVDLQASTLRTQVDSISIDNNLINSKFAFLKNIADTMVKTYKTTFRTINNAQNTITDITNKIVIASQIAPNILSKLEQFQQTIQQFQAGINNFINLPVQLTAQIQNLIHTTTSIADTATNQITSIKNILNGDFIQKYDDSCSFLLENSNASVPIQTTFYCYTLYNYIDIIITLNFESKEQLQVEIQYLIDTLKYLQTRIIDYDLLNSIVLLINNTIILLKKKQNILPSNIEYTFYGINDYAVCYMFYGNIDKINELRTYNNISDYGIADQKIRFI